MRIATLGIILALAPFSVIGQMPAERSIRPPRLFKDSRQQLAIARAQERRDITLVVAAVMGKTAAAARDASRWGGVVRYRDDEVGYLRVRIPLDTATAFSESSSLEAAAADEDDSYPVRLSSHNGDLQSEQWPPIPSDYPLRHPYSVIEDLGASGFGNTGTYDGRGVTIALLDGNIDPLIPEFKTACALDGTRIPKVADYLNVTDPRDDAELNPQWVDMRTEVDGSIGPVSYQGRNFTVPRIGHYRIGLFDERRFNDPANGAYLDQDVDRDGNPKGDDGLFGVLWDERTNDVWVDTNRDGSFADEHALTDYAKRQEFGVFGKDDPGTPERESIAFAVQTDSANKFVSINVGIYQHASEIMGSAVANREPHGRFSGVAPGARVVSMFYGVGITHAAIEGMIRAFRHPLVDLIVFEQNVNMASTPYLLADAHHPISVIAQRLTERYQKLMFVPCGNAPGLGIAQEDGGAPGVLCVGAYQSQDSYLTNVGYRLEGRDHFQWGGLTHGPANNGALKPDLLAPSGQLSTDVAYRKGASNKGLYRLPPGYSIASGTSTAAPMAAAATALIVSAAKQRGLKYDAAHLTAALIGSARYIPEFAAHEQGSGLIQVGAALNLLTEIQDVPLVTIQSRAPVRTSIAALLATPNEGPGLYEREGWTAGARGERTITLTRTSGPSGPTRFTLSWLGNDGTFSGPASVALPLHQPIHVPITIAARTVGAHSAILTLSNQSMPIPEHRLLCTIIVATPFTAENKFSVATTVAVSTAVDRSVFLSVPPNVSALTLSTASPDGPVGLRLVSPQRDYVSPCPTPPAACAVGRPSPGVWEVNVSNTDMTFDENATAPAKARAVKVTTTVAGFDLDGSPTRGWSSVPGSHVTFPVRVANRFAEATASIAFAVLGSAFETTRTLAQGDQHLYRVDVPKGATSLVARIHTESPRADLDMYLLDCTGLRSARETMVYDRSNGGKSPSMSQPACRPRAKASNLGPDRDVEVANPAAGVWIVVIDAFLVPSEHVAYSYLDAFTHPRWGSVAVADVPESRESGSSWTATAHAWAASLPDAPRRLFTRISVTSPNTTQSALGQRPWLVSFGSTDVSR